MAKENGKSTASDTYHHGDLRRALIDAATALMNQGQNWTFSIREVARRAGVSHNAPYNHFADKRELLTAVAVEGFDTLRSRMISAIAQLDDAVAELKTIQMVYVKFGVDNPAHYRLMFSGVLSDDKGVRPPALVDAGLQTKAVLESVIRRGARSGALTPTLMRNEELQGAVLASWAAVHGLTMLLIDGLRTVPNRSVDQISSQLSRIVGRGLLK
jgi:AcrR family transcriptional regulator